GVGLQEALGIAPRLAVKRHIAKDFDVVAGGDLQSASAEDAFYVRRGHRRFSWAITGPRPVAAAESARGTRGRRAYDALRAPTRAAVRPEAWAGERPRGRGGSALGVGGRAHRAGAQAERAQAVGERGRERRRRQCR